MGRLKGRQQTGLVAAKRRERQARRQAHTEAIVAGTVSGDRPPPVVPDLFADLHTSDWRCVNAVPDPRSPATIVYPLSLILHRILTGFLGGARFLGVLFPTTHSQCPRDGLPRTLGALPTLPAVYALVRRIDWPAAHAALAPLWERLGYTPPCVIGRPLRDPQEILATFRQEQANGQRGKQPRSTRHGRPRKQRTG